MAMFAELDPAPLFRFDEDGKVIFTNESGAEILKVLELTEPYISDYILLPKNFNYQEFITGGRSHHTDQQIGEKYYDVIIRGIPETGFGQIYCSDITERKNAEQELELSRQKLRELSTHIQKVQEEEKRKISRELHDNFGQILTAIKMNIETVFEKHKEHIVEVEFADINNQLNKARKEIRELSYRLRPRVLDDFGLVPALRFLCEDVSQRSGIRGFFQAHNVKERLSSEMETNIYRIVQEALNNAVKHSRASELHVQIMKNDEMLTVSVEDNGIGFNSSAGDHSEEMRGMGLVNMSERALSVNGKLYLSSVPGKGTELMVEIPLDSNENDKSSAG